MLSNRILFIIFNDLIDSILIAQHPLYLPRY